MIKSLAMISVLAISFVPIYAEQQDDVIPVYLNQQQPTIYPALTSGISSVPNGYLYFYDFDMDTHNQTIAIDSVDFLLNNTDTTSYDIGGSTVGIQGKYEVIPLALLTWSLGDSTQTWSYNYTNNDQTQMAFIPDSKDQTAKFTLAMLTPLKVLPYDLGVSIRVHYLTTDGQKGIATSKWYDMDQMIEHNSIKGTDLCRLYDYCPNVVTYLSPDNSPPAQPYYPLPEGQDYYLIQTLNQLIQIENQTMYEHAKEYCDSHRTTFNNKTGFMGTALDDTFDQCIEGLTK